MPARRLIIFLSLVLISFITIPAGCRATEKPTEKPPDKPAIPSGPSCGKRDSVYTFTSITTDPNGDGICYRFDWGDGDTSDWTAWVVSGWPGSGTHSWSQAGTYTVKAQAKDVKELASEWSDGHQIIIAAVWSRAFGGSSADWGSSVQPTADGGYIIVGATASYGAGSYDVYLIKTDAEGNQQWFKTFGGSSADYGSSVQQAADGGYIIAGNTDSYGAGRSDVYLIKTDADGNKQWSRTFGGSALDDGYAVAQTDDGGYIIVGGTDSYGAGYTDVYLIKVDTDGELQWDTTLGGSSADWGSSVQPTAHGGYIIVGATASYGAGSYDVYLIKTDAEGNQQWFKTFGGSSADYGFSVQPTDDGGYIIAGNTYSFGAGGSDVYLIKVSERGHQQWFKTFGGSDDDGAYSVQQTSDGGFIIAGWTESWGAGATDVYLIKTDDDGNEQWSKTIGGLHSDYASSVQQAADGGYIITGWTRSYGAGGGDLYLIKTDANGNTVKP
jgi:hypothetical protein